MYVAGWWEVMNKLLKTGYSGNDNYKEKSNSSL